MNHPSENGRRRAIVESVQPIVDDGAFAVKRVVNEPVVVTADVFSDGHDTVTAILLYRRAGDKSWRRIPMAFLNNDRWEASFIPDAIGEWEYAVEGRVDHFATWRADLAKRYAAGQNLAVERQIGISLLDEAVERASAKKDAGDDVARLREWAKRIRDAASDKQAVAEAQNSELAALMEDHYDPDVSTVSKTLRLTVDPKHALFSAWYEFFPRSVCQDGEEHGNFKTAALKLPEVARMGFDIVYLPPIHPIGRENRKGRNNTVTAEAGDPGSPWAIGSEDGGHKAIHPDLGTLEDFKHFIKVAEENGIRVAMDIAFQCAPDHPYVKDHPEWFRWRPDGTVQYAENPPKKYQDIIPFDFETDAWESLWKELKSIFDYWIEQGITVFRVDNPHTKAFPFWQWCIGEIKRKNPEVLFLSEAFTRPKVMYRLAKLGFSQSYTYFTWRNTPWEMRQYMEELIQPPVRDFFRPNFWPNTPDILPELLQIGGKPAFVMRFLLAATLSSNYGMYGPAYEKFIDEPVEGKEEYHNSEKYEVKCWDWNESGNMRGLIEQVNRIRKVHPALQSTWNIQFCDIDNDNLLSYLKVDEAANDILLVVVNFDPFNEQAGELRLPIEELGIASQTPFLVHDLLSDQHNIWHGEWHYLKLDPKELPGRIYHLRPRLRREHDFDYFM